MGCEHTVVAVAVHARWGHEGGEPLEKLQGGQDDLGAAVRCWSGKTVEESGLGGCEGGDAGEGVEAFEGEGRPGTVPDEPFEAASVVALDVHRGVDAEPAGSLPGEHTNGVVFLEQTLGAEVAQNAALDEALEGEPVVRGEPGGLVKEYGSVGDLVEDAVENDQVEVEVGVERGPRPTLRVGARCRKLTAPSCASGGAPGLVRRSVVRMARRKIPRTAPAISGLWWR